MMTLAIEMVVDVFDCALAESSTAGDPERDCEVPGDAAGDVSYLVLLVSSELEGTRSRRLFGSASS